MSLLRVIAFVGAFALVGFIGSPAAQAQTAEGEVDTSASAELENIGADVDAESNTRLDINLNQQTPETSVTWDSQDIIFGSTPSDSPEAAASDDATAEMTEDDTWSIWSWLGLSSDESAVDVNGEVVADVSVLQQILDFFASLFSN